MRLAGRRKLRILASTRDYLPLSRTPYIQAMRIDGRPYARPWTTSCALADGVTLAYRLGSRPDRAWGASAAALPPSYGANRPMPENRCAP